MSTLVSIIIALLVVGLILWLVNKFAPFDKKIKTVINVIVIILLIIWLLRVFGIV